MIFSEADLALLEYVLDRFADGQALAVASARSLYVANVARGEVASAVDLRDRIRLHRDAILATRRAATVEDRRQEGPCDPCARGNHYDCTSRKMAGGCCDGVDPCF